MSNYSTLKQAIQSVIRTNGNEEITGAVLQNALLSIIDSIGANYTFAGVATPQTNAGAPDQNVFYIGGAGTYTNFGDSYIVPEGHLAIFAYNGDWVKETARIQDFSLGVTYTDDEDTNAVLKSAIIRNNTISKIRFTIGTANSLNVVFFDSSDNNVASHFYSSLTAIEETYTFMSGHTNNIVMFNREYLRDIVAANYGKTNYYIGGNFTAEAYDEQYFYLYRNVSDKMMTALGYGWTDSPIINNMLPYAVLTTDVKKIHVTMSRTQINIYLRNENGENLRSKLVEDGTSFDNDVVEIVTGSTTTLTDGLFILNKSAIDRVRERYVLSDYTIFDGTVINDSVYNYSNKQSLFGEERLRNWGTDIDFDTQGAYIGANIYNTVDCFRFPALITEITIPSNKDTIVEIYRTRLDDVSGVSSAVLLDTVQVKAGKYSYPLNIEMNAGDGIGLACPTGSSIKYYNSGWRLASYNIETLLRTSGTDGFANGAMVCSVKYRYFAKPSVPIKKLSGKTISVIGDSISTFGADYSYSNPYYPSSTVTNYLRTWWGRLVQDGASIMKNMSVSRSTIVNPSDPEVAYRWIGYNDRITALGGDGVSPDIIMVLAGINDMFSTSALTDFDFTKNRTNYDELNTSAFSTAYQWIVMKLLDLYPTSKIFLCTPFKAGVSDWGFPEKNGNRYLFQIRDKIKELADALGVGLIDFYSETKISWSQMNGGAYGDTTHPNANGHYEYYKIARKHLIDYVQKSIVL